ncbi:MAG: tetratricopeptide repeat protein [Elusimicrobia bacterium]|nr:tetratricopeptide repeat protein [Elusimicrobiota bacterium]
MKIIAGCALILMVICGNVLADQVIDHKEWISSFHSANEMYKQGKYEEAKDAYESLLGQGLVSANLYYNLGNCYFKLNRLGKAIVNYERAKQIIPLNRELQANLAFVHSQLENPPGQSQSLVKGILNLSTDSFTIDQLTIIVSLFFFLSAGSSGIKLLSKREFTWLRRTALTSFMLLLLFGALWGWKIYQTQVLKYGVTIMPQAECRFAPEETAVTRFRLSEGAKIIILESDGQWLHVKSGDNNIGWVQKSMIEII